MHLVTTKLPSVTDGGSSVARNTARRRLAAPARRAAAQASGRVPIDADRLVDDGVGGLPEVIDAPEPTPAAHDGGVKPEPPLARGSAKRVSPSAASHVPGTKPGSGAVSPRRAVIDDPGLAPAGTGSGRVGKPAPSDRSRRAAADRTGGGGGRGGRGGGGRGGGGRGGGGDDGGGDGVEAEIVDAVDAVDAVDTDVDLVDTDVELVDTDVELVETDVELVDTDVDLDESIDVGRTNRRHRLSWIKRSHRPSRPEDVDDDVDQDEPGDDGVAGDPRDLPDSDDSGDDASDSLEVSEPHTNDERQARRQIRREVALSFSVSIGVAAVLAIAIRRATPLWLPLDASHFVAEAEWLRGSHDILPAIHPPVFPAVVLAIDTVTTPWTAVLLAMCASYAVLHLAIYALIRQFHRPTVAAAATAVAAMTPVSAEILGWGGGANLLGTAFAIGALAATERWVRERRGAWSVGVLIGLSIATHPVAMMLVMYLVGFRVGWALLVHLRDARRRTVPIRADDRPSALSADSSEENEAHRRLRRLGPSSVLGWARVALAAAPFVGVSLYYYLGIQSPGQSALGPPDLSVLVNLLTWAGREQTFIFVMNVAAVLSPFFAFHRASQASSMAVVTVLVLGTALVKGDPSYQSRFIYVLPVLIAFAVAELGTPVVRALASRQRRHDPIMPVLVTTAAVMVLAQSGFAVRLDAAIDFYERVEPEDLALLSGLPSTDGVVASSHYAQSTAEPTSWFLNAATGRPAWSPIGPWLSTVGVETRAGATMQRYFAGQVGIENGRFQVAVTGTPEGYYSIAVATLDDYYYTPLFDLDVARTRWPFPVVSAEALLVSEREVELILYGSRKAQKIEMKIELTDDDVTLEAESGVRGSNDWHVVLTPGKAWQVSRLASSELFVEHVFGDRLLSSDVRVSNVDAPARATIYNTGDPIDFDVVDSRRFGLVWTATDGFVDPITSESFEEQDLADSLDVRQVVVWRNTGVAERFNTDCYSLLDSSANLVSFERTDACG